MKYLLKREALENIFTQAEMKLFASKRLKFEKDIDWRRTNMPKHAGVYALFEGENKLLYVGETGNIQERMGELNRTVNHTFRRQLGEERFGGVKTGKKFAEDVEEKLDDFASKKLYVSFIKVNFGRLEIETYLVTKHQKHLLNSEKKRKLDFK